MVCTSLRYEIRLTRDARRDYIRRAVFVARISGGFLILPFVYVTMAMRGRRYECDFCDNELQQMEWDYRKVVEYSLQCAGN